MFIRRNKRASITTGIVDRSDDIRADDTTDRLSPLTCSIGNQFITMHYPIDGLEQFCEMEIDSGNLSEPDSMKNCSNSTSSSSPDDEKDQINDQFQQEPVDFDENSAANYYQATVTSSTSTCGSVLASGSATRRHTVGPGDVVYEQSLSSQTQGPMINLKFGGDQFATYLFNQHDPTNLLPINLPTLQNQPLQNFSMKNHHLLKPPTVMENST